MVFIPFIPILCVSTIISFIGGYFLGDIEARYELSFHLDGVRRLSTAIINTINDSEERIQ